MKILLVHSLSFGRLQIPIGVLSLATLLEKAGYHVDIIDYNNSFQERQLELKENIIECLDAMADLALSYQADIIGFSCMCSNYHIVLELAKRIKARKPQVKLFLGGPQASMTAERTLEVGSFIDLIAVGECERNINMIVQYLSGEREAEDIPGIVYRKSGKVICNAEADLIFDLEELPKFNYSLVPYMHKLTEIDIEGGRGCPYSCTFCSTKTFWKSRFRLKKAEQLIAEIREIKEVYGVNKFNIIHDLFTANKSKIIEFCDMLIENHLDIVWNCSSRLDTIDEDIALKLKQSGCNKLYFGIETGSSRMQKLINKNLDLDQLLPKMKMLKSLQFDKITLSFIYGFPNETIDDVRETLSIIRQLQKFNIGAIQLHRLTIMNGSELYSKYKDDLKFRASMTSMSGILNQFADELFIRNNPQLFPHFQTVEGFPAELESLDQFISLFCYEMRKNFRSVYDLILEYFNEDLLSVYLHVLKMDDKIFTRLNNSFLNPKVISEKSLMGEALRICIPEFKSYVLISNFAERTQLIQEVFSYELDRLSYYFDMSDCSLEKEYSFDVIGICIGEKGTGWHTINPTLVKFVKDGRKVIARRITNTVNKPLEAGSI
ncbi:MAG: B12-binding domain-containing radical SAM protein [Clostridia bacterium]